jgi:hypothetical protein
MSVKAATLVASATKAGFRHDSFALRPGSTPKLWTSPITGADCTVEKAAFDHFAMEGWRGYGGEGGLVLNLINAMSFRPVPPRHRATFVESLYSGNVAFGSDRYDKAQLLANVLAASEDDVATNFDILSSSAPVYYEYEGVTFGPKSECMLDFFPGLEKWMFLELHRAAGTDLLHRIGQIFATNSYLYRRGWPDLTLWRESELLFVEVKAPGDRLHDSQRTIAKDIAGPLGLDFLLLEVRPGV